METMELTLTSEQKSLLATIAATLAGGRHEFRADATIREESSALVATLRRKRTNESRRNVYKWRAMGERFAFDTGYSEDELSRIAEWQDTIAELPHRDALKRIARALLNPTKDEARFTRKFRKANPDASPELISEHYSAYRESTLKDWRVTVRNYATIRDAAEMIGAFPVSLADARNSNGSRFLNYARKHWTLAGYRPDIHGYSVEDALQDGFLSALESGHWVGKHHMPTYGHLWRHVRMAVVRAAWRNTVATYSPDSSEPFNWDAWAETANSDIAAFVLRTDSASRQTIAEWTEYGEYRAIQECVKSTTEYVAELRHDRMVMLSECRKAFASAILSGLPLATIAHALGRTIEGMYSDLSGDIAPAVTFLPRRADTEAEYADKMDAIARMNGHAHNLRMRRADIQADNYANGRVFRKNAAPSPFDTMDDIPEWRGMSAR